MGSMGAVKNARNSNLELYRILLMFLIVAHHYVVNSGLIEFLSNQSFNIRCIYFYILGMWGKIGINCFLLITGFYMCTSHITLRKFYKLFLEIEFYNIIIYLIFLITSYVPFSLKTAIMAISPVKSISYDFSSCFILFYLTIPFLNILIANLDKSNFKKLLMVILFIYTILPCIPWIELRMNYVMWFSVIYLIGAYIRIFTPPSIIRKISSLLGVSLVLLAAILSVVIMRYVEIKTALNLHYFFVADSNKILAVVTSIALFCFFKDLKIKNSKIINTIASSAFGVLLIHANSDVMRKWIWTDIVDCVGNYNTVHFVGYSTLAIVAIYIVCTIIDQIRIYTIERLFFIWYDKRFNK